MECQIFFLTGVMCGYNPGRSGVSFDFHQANELMHIPTVINYSNGMRISYMIWMSMLVGVQPSR